MSRSVLLAILGIVIPVLALAAVEPGLPDVDDEHWTDEYDRYFRKYTKHYFGPHVDWRWFKAQGIAESHLKPKARGPSGGRGIMQILPTTFKEIHQSNPHLLNVDDPKWNIGAGIYYDRKLYRQWNKGLAFLERLAFTFGSYNAGPGRIRKAYKQALAKDGEVGEWSQAAPHAPSITRHYVRRIRGLMGQDQ